MTQETESYNGDDAKVPRSRKPQQDIYLDINETVNYKMCFPD